MTPIIACPHCAMRVIAPVGRCPACGKDLAAVVEPAAPAAPRRRRHPIIAAIGFMLMAAGLLRWAVVGIKGAHGITDMAWDLALIWAGTLVVLGLQLLGRRGTRK